MRVTLNLIGIWAKFWLVNVPWILLKLLIRLPFLLLAVIGLMVLSTAGWLVLGSVSMLMDVLAWVCWQGLRLTEAYRAWFWEFSLDLQERVARDP